MAGVFDGNTTVETYRAYVAGMCDDIDPEIAFSPPAWLSGEWAGESMTEILGESSGNMDRDDEIASLYEEAADAAFSRELEKVARRMVK